MSRIGTNRIGTNGEVYMPEATKHQTFFASGIRNSDCTRKEKVKALAATLRELADSLDKHADHDAFCTDPVTYPSYMPSEHIATDLVTLDSMTWIDDLLSTLRFSHFGPHWAVNVRLKLGFE